MWEPEPAIQAGEGRCTRFQRPPNLSKAPSSVPAGDGALSPQRALPPSQLSSKGGWEPSGFPGEPTRRSPLWHLCRRVPQASEGAGACLSSPMPREAWIGDVGQALGSRQLRAILAQATLGADKTGEMQ